MGIVFRGIDKELALNLAKTYRLRNFVETGTLAGATSFWAADYFKVVHTVEKSSIFYNKAQKLLIRKKNVRQHLGSSEDILPAILAELDGPSLVWLDAHWSPDLPYAKPTVVCPVIKEILILNRDDRPHVILVDDARLFGIERGWPSMQNLKRSLSFNNRSVLVINDIVVSRP